MLTAVLDVNAVIGLTKGGVFELLPTLYAPLYVPSAVVHEVAVEGKGRPGAAELAKAVGDWIVEQPSDPKLLPPSPPGLPRRPRGAGGSE